MIAGIAFAMALGMYFTFAAVQGDYGLFRRAEILNEATKLKTELAGLHAEIVSLENLTRRMSDDYLDIDLLISNHAIYWAKFARTRSSYAKALVIKTVEMSTN